MNELWLRDRLEEVAKDVGSLRWRLRLLHDDVVDWQMERLAARLEVLMISVTMTAAELLREGYAEESVFRLVDEEKRRQQKLLGNGRPS